MSGNRGRPVCAFLASTRATKFIYSLWGLCEAGFHRSQSRAAPSLGDISFLLGRANLSIRFLHDVLNWCLENLQPLGLTLLRKIISERNPGCAKNTRQQSPSLPIVQSSRQFDSVFAAGVVLKRFQFRDYVVVTKEKISTLQFALADDLPAEISHECSKHCFKVELHL
jgi:hypothetical protein